MSKLMALTVSIGILGAIDTYITATILPLPVWVTFIAWASFFSVGGGSDGLVKSVVSNFTGIVIASLTLLAIDVGGGNAAVAAICVGLGSAAMALMTQVPLTSLAFPIVFGFASTVGTMAALDSTITAADMTHPTLVTMLAMLVGNLFGYVHEIMAGVLTRKTTVA